MVVRGVSVGFWRREDGRWREGVELAAGWCGSERRGTVRLRVWIGECGWRVRSVEG